jgi:hypothetical protein
VGQDRDALREIEESVHNMMKTIPPFQINKTLATYKHYPFLQKPVSDFDAVVIDTNCFQKYE